MTDRQTINFFDSLTEKEIRRRQTLCEKQIALAFAQRGYNDKALANLRKMESDLTDALLRRC